MALCKIVNAAYAACIHVPLYAHLYFSVHDENKWEQSLLALNVLHLV